MVVMVYPPPALFYKWCTSHCVDHSFVRTHVSNSRPSARPSAPCNNNSSSNTRHPFADRWRLAPEKREVNLQPTATTTLVHITGDVYKRLHTIPALVRRTHLGRSRKQLEYVGSKSLPDAGSCVAPGKREANCVRVDGSTGSGALPWSLPWKRGSFHESLHGLSRKKQIVQETGSTIHFYDQYYVW